MKIIRPILQFLMKFAVGFGMQIVRLPLTFHFALPVILVLTNLTLLGHDTISAPAFRLLFLGAWSGEGLGELTARQLVSGTAWFLLLVELATLTYEGIRHKVGWKHEGIAIPAWILSGLYAATLVSFWIVEQENVFWSVAIFLAGFYLLGLGLLWLYHRLHLSSRVAFAGGTLPSS